MKTADHILSAGQIRAWDAFTIKETPISSVDLMEKAATACFGWLEQNGWLSRSFSIYCGKGNNGGDGLALARLLAQGGAGEVSVFILESGRPGSADFQANLKKLHETRAAISFIQSEQPIHPVRENDVVIDALFGTGLSRPLEGTAAQLVQHLNNSGSPVISIDIPGGMFADKSSGNAPVIRAGHTLSFQTPKLAFFVAETAAFTGEVHLLDIGLKPEFLNQVTGSYETITPLLIKEIYRPRKNFTHKGSYGHAALIAGSKGMAGAAVLAAAACLRSGAGKLSCYSTPEVEQVLQTALPEAMVKPLQAIRLPGFSRHEAAGIGPGLGTAGFGLLTDVFNAGIPLVIDADALNMLSEHRLANQGPASGKNLPAIPPLSILTPHPKEFDRLFGAAGNDFDRLEKAREAAARLNIILVLKGHHTLVAMPGGKAYFNTTGNPGMATAGSGDVLTGIITGLLAQHYAPERAALLGVYLHGLAGDFAAAHKSQEAMIARDIIDHLGAAYLAISQPDV